MTNTTRALPIEIQLCRQLYQQLLQKHGLLEVLGGAEGIEDSISNTKIKMEKDKQRLRHAKEVEKQNDTFRKKHEQNQKSCKK